jgi:hypothetical protein
LVGKFFVVSLHHQTNKETMKTLHNIWDLKQLANNTLVEISFELDKLYYGQYEVNYRAFNKASLVDNIYNELLEEGKADMTDMIDYLIELVKDGKITLPNH